MRKINLKSIVYLLVLSMFLPGCAGLKKMKKNADKIQFKTTPEVLEAHANKVDLAIDGIFPANYFNKKAVLVVTPSLKYEGGETKYAPITVQGEKVQANNRVISYAAGGNFSYKNATDYINAMSKSGLYVNITASKGKKNLDFNPIKIADGVIATSQMVENMPKAIIGVQREPNTTGKYDPNIDAFQRIVPDEMVADIHYLINRSNIRSEETTATDVKDFETYTRKANEDEKINLKQIEVSAYASPDGTIDFNTELAAERKNTSSAYLAQRLKEAGVNIELKTKYTPEDWEGFKEVMESSNIRDKELILRVLSMYNDPEVREREIRNLAETFTAVAEEILPQLRRAKMVTSADFIGKSDEELKALAKSNPASLNPAELLYAATLFEDLNEQLSIYNSFIRVYPNDWRGHNNAGYVMVKQKKYADAKPLFGQAERLKNNEPIVKNNLGAVNLYEGNIAVSETLFGAASGAGSEVNYNLGMVSIKKAEYDQAVRYFDRTADVNSALAKIMAGDNNGALRDLETNTAESATKEYLKAIIGARTARESLLIESLQKAVNLDSNFKAKAKNDIEFMRYFNNSRFSAIVN
ncbi:MAG: hypothetical protein LBV47_03990 [Bacteroidales bacterium]|nr:hypothetical protein [Bacteroidales bacterium]